MNRREALCGLIAGSTGILRASEPPERLDLGGARLDVYIDSDDFSSCNAVLLDWVKRSARAVMAYFGRFPVAQARLYIAVTDRGRVSRGVSYSEGGAHITICVGRSTTVHDINAAWELTHEMVHFGFPSVNRRHHWIEEGTDTYVEPIARAMTGILTGEQVWREMRRDMLQGLPEPGD